MNLMEEMQWLRERVKDLEEQNEFLHNVIDNYISKENEEKTITNDSVTQYEEWLDSPEADMLAKAYANYYDTQEVAIEEDTTHTEDAKERMAQSHLWL